MRTSEANRRSSREELVSTGNGNIHPFIGSEFSQIDIMIKKLPPNNKSHRNIISASDFLALECCDDIADAPGVWKIVSGDGASISKGIGSSSF